MSDSVIGKGFSSVFGLMDKIINILEGSKEYWDFQMLLHQFGKVLNALNRITHVLEDLKAYVGWEAALTR